MREAEDQVLRGLDPAEREMLRGLLRRAACDLRDIDIATDRCAVVDEVLGDRAASGGATSRAGRGTT